MYSVSSRDTNEQDSVRLIFFFGMATTSQIVVFTVAFLLGLSGATGHLLLLVPRGKKFIFVYEP